MTLSKPIKIGIIGAGRIGKLHAEHLAFHIRDAEPVAISDILEPAAVETAKNCNIPVATKDYHAILDDPAVQAVLICSSTDTHARLIEEAAGAGKHIFCEKPIALALPAIRQALEAVDKAGVKLQIGFNRRFDANFAKVRELVSAGQVGEPHILRITSRDPEPPPVAYWPHSGGIFMDMTIHDFDMARFLLSSEVEQVYATGDVLIEPGIAAADDIDTAVITLKFENRAIATIDNSRKSVYGYDQRVEVFGSKGMVCVSNNKPDNHMLWTAETVQSSRPLYFFLERYKDSFIAELQAFVDCIVADTEPPVTGFDGLKPVQIALAAKKSLSENRPVKVTEIA